MGSQSASTSCSSSNYYAIGWDWRPDGSKRPRVLSTGANPGAAAEIAKLQQPLPGAKYGIFQVKSSSDGFFLDAAVDGVVMVVEEHRSAAMREGLSAVPVLFIGTIVF